MIRGINKKVIEIKNCNSAYFERAFLVVRSEKCNISDELLNFNAELFVSNIAQNEKNGRKKPKKWVFPLLMSLILNFLVCLIFYFLFFR